MSMNASMKRKRKNSIKAPASFQQNESLEIVASMYGPIRITPTTAIDKDILLQRLKIELLDRFIFKRNSVKKTKNGENLDTSKEKGDKVEKNKEFDRSECLNKYLVVGVNQCTRVLEQAFSRDGAKREEMKPSLVMLSRDLRPPTILAHIPSFCKQLDVPMILLPGRASSEIGNVFGIKSASVVIFMTQENQSRKDLEKSEIELCKSVNSYIDFAKRKISH